MNNNRCIYCGDIIPEGRIICPHCEKNNKLDTDILWDIIAEYNLRREQRRQLIQAIHFIERW